jgi:hypothetical protein
MVVKDVRKLREELLQRELKLAVLIAALGFIARFSDLMGIHGH